jgi:hypothetical protein
VVDRGRTCSTHPTRYPVVEREAEDRLPEHLRGAAGARVLVGPDAGQVAAREVAVVRMSIRNRPAARCSGGGSGLG